MIYVGTFGGRGDEIYVTVKGKLKAREQSTWGNNGVKNHQKCAHTNNIRSLRLG